MGIINLGDTVIVEFFIYTLTLGVYMEGVFAIVKLAFVSTLLAFPLILIGRHMVKEMEEKWKSPFWINCFIVSFILFFIVWYGIVILLFS